MPKSKSLHLRFRQLDLSTQFGTCSALNYIKKKKQRAALGSDLVKVDMQPAWFRGKLSGSCPATDAEKTALRNIQHPTETVVVVRT